MTENHAPRRKWRSEALSAALARIGRDAASRDHKLLMETAGLWWDGTRERWALERFVRRHWLYYPDDTLYGRRREKAYRTRTANLHTDLHDPLLGPSLERSTADFEPGPILRDLGCRTFHDVIHELMRAQEGEPRLRADPKAERDREYRRAEERILRRFGGESP